MYIHQEGDITVIELGEHEVCMVQIKRKDIGALAISMNRDGGISFVGPRNHTITFVTKEGESPAIQTSPKK